MSESTLDEAVRWASVLILDHSNHAQYPSSMAAIHYSWEEMRWEDPTECKHGKAVAALLSSGELFIRVSTGFTCFTPLGLLVSEIGKEERRNCECWEGYVFFVDWRDKSLQIFPRNDSRQPVPDILSRRVRDELQKLLEQFLASRTT